MYIMIGNIEGEKRIDLSYPIQNFDSSKEVAVVRVFSDNIWYESTAPWMMELELGNKWIMAGTYTRRELINLIEGKLKLAQFDEERRITRTNKLAGIMEIVLTLDELDNADNFEDRKSGHTLFTYHVTAYDNSTHFEPCTPQYKKLKNGELVSLALRMTHKKNNIITDGLATTIVLHIQ